MAYVIESTLIVVVVVVLSILVAAYVPKYCRWRRDVKEYPTIPFHSFKEFFELEPNKYKEHGFYLEYLPAPVLMSSDENVKWYSPSESMYINIDSFFGMLKANRMIKNYKKEKNKYDTNDLRRKREAEYYKAIQNMITKTIEENEKNLQQEIEKYARTVESLGADVQRIKIIHK